MKGQLDEAILCYQKVIELNPNEDRTYYNLGNTLRKQGRLQLLRTNLRNTVSQSPLTDAGRFTTDLENWYRTIWEE